MYHGSVTRSASKAALKFKVAKFLAGQGPDDLGPEDPTMREHGARLMVRSEVLDNAYLVLISEPEPSEEERLALFATVEEASDAVDKELEEFKTMAGVLRVRAEPPA